MTRSAALVADTMVVSALVNERRHPAMAAQFRALVDGRLIVISFVTVTVRSEQKMRLLGILFGGPEVRALGRNTLVAPNWGLFAHLVASGLGQRGGDGAHRVVLRYAREMLAAVIDDSDLDEAANIRKDRALAEYGDFASRKLTRRSSRLGGAASRGPCCVLVAQGPSWDR